METYKPCEFVQYTGHAPLFTQSVERVRYGWSKANGFVCHVPNEKHLLYLVSRVAKLIPVVPVEKTTKEDTAEVKPKPEAKAKGRRSYGKK